MTSKVFIIVTLMFVMSFGAITGYWYLTPTGDGTKVGTSLANAFDIDSLEKYIEDGTVANGAVVFVWGGTYTFNATINFSTSADGTATNPVIFKGVKSSTTNEGAAVVYSDFAIDTADMPLWNIGDYQFITGDYTILENLKAKGNSNGLITGGSVFTVINCVLNLSYTTPAGRYSITGGNYINLINSYVFSDSCNGINLSISSGCKIVGNYFYTPHAAAYGISIAAASNSIYQNNTFDRSGSIAISLTSGDHSVISNNTFHKCKNDVDGTDANDITAIDNVHDSTVNVCYRFTTQSDVSQFRNNAFGTTISADSQYVNVDTATTHQDYWKKSGALYLDSTFTISDTNSVAYRAGYIGR